MKKLLLLSLVVSQSAFAWVSGSGVTIDNVVVWEGAEASTYMYFKTSSDVWCYIPPGQKLLNSTVLALYTSKNRATIHCHDAEETKQGGVPAAHKLHRIYAL